MPGPGEETEVKRWPGESDEAHPEVFNIPPPMPAKLKPGMLSEKQFKHFFEEVGFFEDVHYCTCNKHPICIDRLSSTVTSGIICQFGA